MCSRCCLNVSNRSGALCRWPGRAPSGFDPLFSRSSPRTAAATLGAAAAGASRARGRRFYLGLAPAFCCHRLFCPWMVFSCLAARAFPVLTRQRCVLAGALGLSLGFLQALARASKLVFREAYALLGYVGLQSGSFDSLRP